MRSLGSRSGNSPSFFKAKPATARALLFSCPSLRVCSDAPGQFVAQSAQYFPFFPTSGLRCPSSGRTKGRFSEKPRDIFLRRRAAYPQCILNLCGEGKHRVPILCINSAAFSLFPSAGKLSESTFRLHPYSFHRPFYNKTFSPRTLSQLSQNSQPKIPTCSDCPRTILYLISHFKNFSL